MSKTSGRLFWGNNYPDLPKIDLTRIQRDSFAWFLNEGIGLLISDINPIEDFTGKNWLLEFNHYSLGAPKLPSAEALIKGVNYDASLKIEAKLTNKQTNQTSKQEVFLGDLPMITENGTFVINGIERAVVNQLVRSPGVYFTGETDPITGRMLYGAELRPMRGAWLEFNIARNDVVTVRIDRKRKFPVTTFLRALGMGDDEEILKTFGDFIDTTLSKDSTKGTSEAVLELYRKMRPGEPAVLDTAREFLANLFFNPRRYDLSKVGRFKINKRLGLSTPNETENWVLTREDIIKTIQYLIALQNGKGEADDIDHLANRRVRPVGELVGQIAFRIGLLRLERAVKERMSMLDLKTIPNPGQVVNARPIIAAINEFFRSSQLSTILEQTNPLSEVDNLRRLTVMGVGGISRERASFSIRDINSSQYGKICPVRSPEGPNIGLVTYLALYARINEYGFLESPYRKVEKIQKGQSVKMRATNQIDYLAAYEELGYHITHLGTEIDKNGFIISERVPVRYGGEFIEIPSSEVEYIDMVPRQVVGVSASLIPFLQNDDVTRALMGSNMQPQAVPLLKPQAPIVGTGMESEVAQAMGRVIKTKKKGRVKYVDGRKVIIDDETYNVEKFKRTSQSTCYSQKVLVSQGETVEAGQVIIDGPASENGELALGANLVIAYMSYQGLGYEDAIVISERLVKEDLLTSIHIEEHEAEVVDTKLGPEELTRDIPNVGDEDLMHLDEGGIVVVGTEVGPNSILVGKIAPKGETELTAEERLLRAIFGEKAREVRDTSLRIPHGERGIVIGVQILDRGEGDELPPGTNKLIKVKVAQIRKVTIGDKLAGRHGNKGVISKIIPEADMPYLSDGTTIDIIISPLSVLNRMNLGQLMETHLGWAAKTLDEKIAVPVFEKAHYGLIEDKLKNAGLPVSGKTTVYDGRTGDAHQNEVTVGVSYVMKLIHMVEDKTHARSTGPYSLVTQQPLGGKAQMGGQRLGEMEVWALEAHRAAHILQEMLTIKSDDVVGRARAFEAIVKGLDIPQSNVPESFKVLVK